jgi:hypothetical protein
MENKRVAEVVYDELKMVAGMQERCVLQFRGDNGGLATLETRIRDVFEDADGQFLITESGLLLALSQLVSINTKPVALFC